MLLTDFLYPSDQPKIKGSVHTCRDRGKISVSALLRPVEMLAEPDISYCGLGKRLRQDGYVQPRIN